ncbi:MAG: restriction endonuclease subunit S [Treponema sp.]|nr:restriction endonuclease subunit S [Treponema sp.]
MEEWKECKLGEIVDSSLGKMLNKNKNKGTYEPYLANVNVRWGNFVLDNLSSMKFDSNEEDRYSLKYGDLVLCEGGEPGRCAIWKNNIPNMKIQKALHRIRCHREINNFFLFYWFLLAGKRGMLSKYFTGTTIQHLPSDKLKSIDIKLSPLPTQQKIARILSSLDDKIELNNKINTNLEQQAHVLFKNWFVDFAPFGGKMPEGWKVGKLSEIGTIVGGSTPSKAKKRLLHE